MQVRQGSDSRRGRTAGHLGCPFCAAYEVSRLYLGSLGVDCCTCATCGATWEESQATGDYRGQPEAASVVIRSR